MDASEKVRLLREATLGASDVFAVRTERGWKPVYAQLEDMNLLMHLGGQLEIGSYPMIPQETGHPRLWWIGADFDGKTCKAATAMRGQCMFSNKRGARFCEACGASLPDWERDVRRATQFLYETGANLLVNLSRSAAGAHVRVLFREPVPAWMARRWLQSWLEEAQVTEEDDVGIPSSFDRLIPPQDVLMSGINPKSGKRFIGNLMGSPLNARLAKACGGTLPISIEAAMRGDFAPDGKHWDYVVAAIENREWGEAELKNALGEAPGDIVLEAPAALLVDARELPVIRAEGALHFTLGFCEFMKYMRKPGYQGYDLWVALAANLHRFGEDGRAVFHEVSQSDPRYRASDVDQKWQQTEIMHPVRCDTIATMGYRCPHLDTNRCAGAAAPAYFFEHAEFEPL